MKLFRINSPLTALRAVIGWPLLVIGLYMLAALIGSHIPMNNDWREPKDGVEIFVESNGIHVSLIVPISEAGEDLSDLIRPDQLSDSMLYGTHAMIGWGHAGVYRNARTWADMRSGDVASAIFGSNDVLLHIYHLTDPQPLSYRRSVRITTQQYRNIIAQIRSSFRLQQGRSTASPAYAADNLFYEATGRYTAFHTCNEWTGGILRKAGIRVGAWTPLAGGVMHWFPQTATKLRSIAPVRSN